MPGPSPSWGGTGRDHPGHPLLDDYLAFVAARARTNTWLAVASDLKIFFGVVAKAPELVNAADVFAFLASQRAPAWARGRAARGRRAWPGGTYDRPPVVECAWPVRLPRGRGDSGVSRSPVPTSLAPAAPVLGAGRAVCR
ncbi:integrase family domain protein [Mycobacterium xenopi 4042]|uniref:Integrase family domain protein n=1 Tax=Mycobacterium xenopi 4042 TaxID=1299334 RepID=X7ZB89_MYCXE|nr:integrase family domain protein [Mycobacterium xenopi 4042]